MNAPAMEPFGLTETAPGAARGGDDVSPGWDLQDGVRSDGGGGCSVAGAGDPGLAGGGRVYHADSDLGEHECALHYDWREGG